MIVHEERVASRWLDVCLLVLAAAFVAIACSGVALVFVDVPKPPTLPMIFATVVLPMLAGALFIAALAGGYRLTVDGEQVRARWGIFRILCLRLKLADIVSVEPTRFRSLWDFGGYGIRWNCGKTWGYILSNQGVRFTMRSGKRITVSVKDPEQVVAAITPRLSSIIGDPSA